MLKDITLGQYFPGNSAIHRMDPRMKIILTLVYIAMLFAVSNPLGLPVAFAVPLAAFLIARIPLGMALKTLKPMIPIVLFTAVLNMFFVDGVVLWQWSFFRITVDGLYFAGMMATRILLLVLGTALLTYTTSPISLTDGIERLLSPLKRIHFPAHELAMMMTIALRFIPTLVEETDKIMSAQKARGADMESGGLMQRVRALIPILIPLFVSSFRRAYELATAMECRCYRGGEGRTRMKQLHMNARDGACIAVMAALVAALFALNFLLPAAL